MASETRYLQFHTTDHLFLLPPTPHPLCLSSYPPTDHSVYDSFSWMREQGDPGFRYFQAAARLWGLMALRLANSAILPFDLTCQATALETYLAKLTDINANGAIGEREQRGRLGGSGLGSGRGVLDFENDISISQ